MMRATVLSAALAGVASAIHVPGRLAPVLPGSLAAHLPQHERRQVSGVRPDIIDDLPEDCRDAAESFVSALPAEPSSFEEFSSSFYETASRTASETYLDCAWVTEMPESLYTEFTDYADELVDWLEEEENIKKVMDFGYECEEWASNGGLASAGDSPCQFEWDEFADMAIEETGWTPKAFRPDFPEDYNPADREKDKDSAASMPTFAAAAALATFIGGVALL